MIFRLLCLCTLLIIAFSGCVYDSQDRVVARLGSYNLEEKELVSSIGRFENSRDSATKANIYIEDWKVEMSMYARALEEGIDEESHTRMLLMKARRKIIVDLYLEKKIKDESEKGRFRVDISEVEDYYNKHDADFVISKRKVKFRKIYTNTRANANKLRRLSKDVNKLENRMTLLPEDIRDLNNEQAILGDYFVDIESVRFDSPNLIREFKGLTLGEMTRPKKISDSLYLLIWMLDKKKPGEKLPLKDVYATIEDRLRRLKQKKFHHQLSIGTIE